MVKSNETLSDLLTDLENCRDTVLLLSCTSEEKLASETLSNSVLFGVYSHLNLLCKEFG